ncbi:hypothetical protein F383_27976 [Gossypium arboreum]|uniref:Uncharacterized protein n=1 Tax=Gossypium arboreum TaxID=29729 RepID=A0A0B0P534_GOSAR|nr:hypothetical protein F383_27976 [Gossypium arboreum]
MYVLFCHSLTHGRV